MWEKKPRAFGLKKRKKTPKPGMGKGGREAGKQKKSRCEVSERGGQNGVSIRGKGNGQPGGTRGKTEKKGEKGAGGTFHPRRREKEESNNETFKLRKPDK